MTTRYLNARDLGGSPLEFAVRDGLFVAPGGEATCVDLDGRLVLPAWYEAHCHVLPEGLDMLKLSLRPCRSRDEVLEAVRDAAGQGEGWLHAVHYDQTKFPGAEHLTRDDLDRVCPIRPVLLRHSNGHASVANSAALTATIDPDTPDPAGGTYVRDATGRMNGVLLERAHERVTELSPPPSLDDMVQAVLRAGAAMAADGVTTATDMGTGRWDLETELRAYKIAADRGCAVRLRLYLQWSAVFGRRATLPDRREAITAEMDKASCRVCGVKLFSDGAIGSATAAIHGQFATTLKNGQLMYAPSELSRRITQADREGWKVAVHAIGDRAVDHVMDAFAECDDPKRHRIEHAMILDDAQVDRLANLGCHVSVQPEFLVRFGHAYRTQLPNSFSRLNRVASLMRAGIPLSFSSDRPITVGNPAAGVVCATDRPQGFDEGENISLADATRLYTQGGWESNDEGPGGRIAPGLAADFQVFDGVLSADARPSQVYRAGQLATKA